MKKFYTLILLIFFSGGTFAQYYYETVGNPSATTSINTYAGWSDTLDYSGTAMADTVNPSVYIYNNVNQASGGGNIFFTNTAGTYFEISGLDSVYNYWGVPSINITFMLSSFDTATPYELLLQASVDSGATWDTLPYYNFPLASTTGWSLFSATINLSGYPTNTPNPFDPPYIYTNVNKVFFRFTQTTSSDTFRIDDIQINFVIPLAVKLEFFTAIAEKTKNLLKWKAHSTSDNEIFVLEKSIDGRSFSAIAQQYARGKGEYDYDYADEKGNGTIYYRLKMIDEAGRFSYSGIVTVNAEDSNEFFQAVYPSPANDRINIALNSPWEQTITLMLLDIQGCIQIQKEYFALRGMNNYEVNVQKLPAGNYFLKVRDRQYEHIRKVMISR